MTNDMTQAALITGAAIATHESRGALLQEIAVYVEDNPYEVYADRNDCISDAQAAMLLAGDFESFDDSMWQWETNASDYAQWGDLQSDVLNTFGERIIAAWPDDELDDDSDWGDMPQEVQDTFDESTCIDCSDLITSAIRAYDGMIAATLYKRNGEPIEFQGAWGQEWDKRAAEYLKRHCGINPRKSEPTYAGTYMKALGTVDLLQVYKTGVAPTHVYVTPHVMTIGHDRLNGSGTLGDDQYKGRPRWFKAQFRVDALDSYGVDSVFGLTGCWRSELEVR
jgi:hypothetical protein